MCVKQRALAPAVVCTAQYIDVVLYSTHIRGIIHKYVINFIHEPSRAFEGINFSFRPQSVRAMQSVRFHDLTPIGRRSSGKTAVKVALNLP